MAIFQYRKIPVLAHPFQSPPVIGPLTYVDTNWNYSGYNPPPPPRSGNKTSFTLCTSLVSICHYEEAYLCLVFVVPKNMKHLFILLDVGSSAFFETFFYTAHKFPVYKPTQDPLWSCVSPGRAYNRNFPGLDTISVLFTFHGDDEKNEMLLEWTLFFFTYFFVSQ